MTTAGSIGFNAPQDSSKLLTKAFEDMGVDQNDVNAFVKEYQSSIQTGDRNALGIEDKLNAIEMKTMQGVNSINKASSTELESIRKQLLSEVENIKLKPEAGPASNNLVDGAISSSSKVYNSYMSLQKELTAKLQDPNITSNAKSMLQVQQQLGELTMFETLLSNVAGKISNTFSTLFRNQ